MLLIPETPQTFLGEVRGLGWQALCAVPQLQGRAAGMNHLRVRCQLRSQTPGRAERVQTPALRVRPAQAEKTILV